MKLIRTVVLLCAAAVIAESYVSASGPVGIYGIVTRVVFEPNETAPERLQVWGSFAYVENSSTRGGGAPLVSNAERGYLYFKLPAIVPGFVEQHQIDLVKREWADLKAVAGTGQAVGFGSWGYIGRFEALRPGAPHDKLAVILERVPAAGGTTTDMRVRPATEAPAAPATYQTNTGIVKLNEQGSHRAVVMRLKDAPQR
jgi:hypothetical protein